MFIFHPGNREIPVELTDRKVDNINQTDLIMLLCVAIFLMPILSFVVEQNQRPNRVNVSSRLFRKPSIMQMPAHDSGACWNIL